METKFKIFEINYNDIPLNSSKSETQVDIYVPTINEISENEFRNEKFAEAKLYEIFQEEKNKFKHYTILPIYFKA
jgi:hypothetical protein